MTKAALLIFMLAFCLSACKKENVTIPECIIEKIGTFKTNSCEFGASVKEYQFQGRYVYTFYIGFCAADFPIPVVDANCNSIGSLGGLSGNTKVAGVEFSTAVYKRTIWQG